MNLATRPHKHLLETINTVCKKLLFTVLIVITGSAFAQAPEGFNYQGLARDGAGKPLLNKSISIRASILTGSPTGTAQYVETQVAQTDSFGLFSAVVGNGTIVTGTFSSITWGAATKFLKVEFDPNGGTSYILSGTSQISSVPYSLFAKNAGNAANGGFSNMQVFNANGNFTIPAGVTKIMIEVWGGGAGGRTASTSAVFGGGGGGYGKEIFTVVPNTNYIVTVGTGGAAQTNGGTSSFGSLISAIGGTSTTPPCIGGTSSAAYNVTGGTGGLPLQFGTSGANAGGNGGTSYGSSGGVGSGNNPAETGIAPGGGGGGGSVGYTTGGNGAIGRVIVWY